MKNNKKIIKAITNVITQTMYQHGTHFSERENGKNVTKKVVKKEVKKLIDGELDCVEIIIKLTDSFLKGIK